MQELLQLLTVEQLASLIHKSPSSIRSDSIRNPKSLPPILRIPGSRRLLFCDYNEWVKSLHKDPTYSTDMPSVAITMLHKLRRGRPTKAQQLARTAKLESSPIK